MKKKFKLAVTFTIILVILLAVAWGYILTCTISNRKEISYNVENMKDDLKVISNAPHSNLIHKENLQQVREYIVEELKSCDVKTKIYTYDNVPTHKETNVQLNNIYGQIDGKNGEKGSYILLVSHYDSASSNPQYKEGYSYGAADAGYGVATILETVRKISEKKDSMINGIKILITDGEELRLIGSKNAVENNPEIFENVSYVINLEARGTSGASVLCELNGDNRKVLELYKKGSCQITNSFVTGLYGGSDRSDFYNIAKLNIPGINLISLDKVENYHTQNDSFSNICEETLKHTVTQVLPITEEFVSNEKYSKISYFRGSDESQFLNIFPGKIMDISSKWIYAIGAAITIITIAITIKNRKIILEVVKIIGTRMGLLLVVFIGTLAVSFVLALITDTTFILAHMGKIPGDDIIVIAIPVVFFIFMLFSKFQNKYNENTVVVADIILSNIVLIILTLVFTGAAYLIIIPLALLIIVYFINLKFAEYTAIKYLYIIPAIAGIFIAVPIMFYFQIAFSIAALALNCGIALGLYYTCQKLVKLEK